VMGEHKERKKEKELGGRRFDIELPYIGLS
jgi:hypothetical protein